MNEIMEWLADHHVPVILLAATLVWVIGSGVIHAGGVLWRWWRGRREAKRLVANFEAAMPLKQGEGMAALKEAREYIAKPAPDHKYQGDQVTSLRKELLALEERIDRRLGDAEALLGTVEVHVFAPLCAPVTPAPVEAGVRVFKDGSWYRLFYGADGYVNMGANFFPSTLALGTALRWTVLFPDFTELPKDSPECQRIVASWTTWRKGQ